MTEGSGGSWSKVPTYLGHYPPTGTESNSYFFQYLYFKEMDLRFSGRQFWVVEDLYLKGTEKSFVIASFL